MSTIEDVVTTGRRRRRRHSVFFKAEAVSACQQPGVSIASVAMDRGLNANLLRKWVQAAERGDAPIVLRPASPASAADRTQDFVPISLPARSSDAQIQVELRNGAKRLTLQWPASLAHECVTLLRALMK